MICECWTYEKWLLTFVGGYMVGAALQYFLSELWLFVEVRYKKKKEQERKGEK